MEVKFYTLDCFLNMLYLFPVPRVKEVVENSLAVIKEAFDNEVTPYFALVICLWGK